MSKVTAAFRQQAFRGRNDDVGLNTATWNGGGGLNGNWTQAVDTNFRVRFVVEETAGGSENLRWALYYSHNGGTYAEVTASTPIKVVGSTHFADDAATTSIMSGTGTFLAGYGSDVDAQCPNSGNQSWSGSQYTEHEFSLSLDSAQVANADTIALQVRKFGGATITYNQTPTITVNEATNVNVAATTDALTLAEQSATISADISFTANTDALTLAEQAATVAFVQNVQASVDSLTLAENAATVALDVAISAGTDALTLAELAANVNAAVSIAAGTDALTLAEQSATVSLAVAVNATTDALTLAEQSANINAAINVAATTDALTIAEQAASVSLGVDVAAGVDAITLAELAAAISYDVTVNAGVDALTLAESAANINAETNVAAGTDALTLAEQAALVTIAASGVEVSAGVDTLTLAAYAATVGVPQTATPEITWPGTFIFPPRRRDEQRDVPLPRKKTKRKIRRMVRLVAEHDPELVADILDRPKSEPATVERLMDGLDVNRLLNDTQALRELYTAYYALQDEEDDLTVLLLAA